MIIAGTNFEIEKWPEVKTTPGIGPWKQLSTGFQAARDFGIARDKYETKIKIFDSLAVLNSLQNVLNANRGALTISGLNSEEIIFGANVDYSASINATVTDFGIRQNIYNDALFQLEIGFRVISKTLLTTTPSLSTLKLVQGWKGDKSFDITKLFAYNQIPSYLENGTDAGFFVGNFLQTTEQMKAIRAYLLTIARTKDIPFPKLFQTDFYPFGANDSESAFQKCNIISWQDRQVDFGWWDLQIVFAQAKPYFEAGDADGETDGAFFLRPSDTLPLDYLVTPEA